MKVMIGKTVDLLILTVLAFAWAFEFNAERLNSYIPSVSQFWLANLITMVVYLAGVLRIMLRDESYKD